jgi:hypothetical protein
LVTALGAQSIVSIDGMEMADVVNQPIPTVEVGPAQGGGASQSNSVHVSQAGGYVKGPATVTGVNYSNLRTLVESPLRSSNVGFFAGKVVGITDAARRHFGPVAVRYTNLATVDPAAWTYFSGAGTITTGITAPDGTTGAGQTTSTSGQSFVQFYSSSSVSYGVGDIWIYGVWERTTSANAITLTPPRFSLNGHGFGQGGTCTPIGGPGTLATTLGASIETATIAGDGEWRFESGMCKMLTAPAPASYDVNFAGTVDATHTNQFYAPILIKVPAGTVSDNEAYEIATNLQSYGPGCPVGSMCGLPAQPETIQNSGNGATWVEGHISELITLSTSGTTTDSMNNLLPANSIIEAVVARVTTTITSATDWKLGDATIVGRFTGADSVMTANETQVGTVMADQTGTSGPRQVSAAKLRVSTTGTPGAGKIRVTVFYRTFTPPTS